MTNAQDSDMNSEEDLYYFETDHLALRGNKDYSEVLKTLLILCAQRKQAIRDYNNAVELKKEALADPGKILEKIVNGESLGMPDMHSLPELPVIDWSKYDIKISEENFKHIYSDVTDSLKKKHETPDKKQKNLQRKWTTEEQKRLEELLQIYPPEPIEMRRFKKIADALGNRTIQQVSSRVQKYFLKLYKAGLPIPGRIPKSAEKYKKSALHKHQRHNHYLWKPTTFFPDLCVPVVMNDLDNIPGPSSKIPDDAPQASTSTNYLIPSSYHQESEILPQKTETELQLDLLRRIRKVKIRDAEGESGLFQHIGFKCDYCGEEPIVGTRWHCNTCKADSVDFCTDCILAQLYSDSCHPLNHSLASYNDKGTDYLSDSGSNTGSAVGSSNINHESSDSSDSEFNSQCINEDEEMTDEISGTTQDQVFSNGILEEACESDIKIKQELFEHDGKIKEEIFDNSSKLSFENFQETEHLFGEGLDTNLFSEIDNISYDYLHTNLLLDKE